MPRDRLWCFLSHPVLSVTDMNEIRSDNQQIQELPVDPYPDPVAYLARFGVTAVLIGELAGSGLSSAA